MDFHLFADLFYKHKNMAVLESNLNEALCANKLSLNIEKSNFVMFHTSQKKLEFNINLFINKMQLKQEYCTKYMGVLIDSNLNWKS